MTTTQMELLPSLDLALMTDNLKKAIHRLQEGKIVLLLDARERENEGDLVVAAEKITAETMNFLIKQGSGVVCLALPKKRLDYLGLPLMSTDNTNFYQTAFTVSIEARTGVTTGVSAKDRSHTIQVAMADDAHGHHLAKPGHVFPLAAQTKGVFDRMGHTEGSVDLMRMAGLKPGAVLCELMNEDGSMTIGEARINFAKTFDIPVVSIEEIWFHRIRTEDVFERISSKNIDTRFGKLSWHSFRFLNSVTVEVFHRSDFAPEETKPARLLMVPGDNLSRRFMAAMLHPSDDDPLLGALSQLKSATCQLAIMTTVDKTANITKDESTAKVFAMVCRTLAELKVNQIVLDGIDAELLSVAQNHFAIKVAEKLIVR